MIASNHTSPSARNSRLRILALALNGTRASRLWLCFLAAPPIASIALIAPEIFLWVLELRPTNISVHKHLLGLTTALLSSFFFIVFVAYILMGLQALIAGFIMEYLVRPHAPHKAAIVVASCLLGLLAATSLNFLIPAEILIPPGLFTGLILGLVLATGFKPTTRR